MILLEVLGEGPSLTVIWVMLLSLGVISGIAAYFQWWLAIPPFSILVVFIVFWLSEIHEPDIYMNIMKEDPYYIPGNYAAMFVSLLPPLFGLYINLKRRRTPSK